MSRVPALTLPKELEPHRKQISQTVAPYISVIAKNEKANIHQSKFGGHPYLPKEVEHPKDRNGKPMLLLAQINFKELPKLDDMPEKGLLQFFITAEDDLMGLDFDNMTKQSNFKILYHPTISSDPSGLISDFSYLEQLNTEFFPIERESSLSFQIAYDPVSIEDFRASTLLGKSIDFSFDASEEDEELWEAYAGAFRGEGHKIGGYPFFTQTDPRDDEKYKEHEILLLQIDTDDENGIMWGDAGVANFFIKKEDLLNLHFENVLYNWDCH
ncbi:YwqG family protein [Pseudalkalibacillus sp. SCS-8]|uniref:YwqG family protein n=1 Tax=Pseudalkalibacillus nanhaiensis TaxID=3115291 RepID=UPI0032DA9928